MAIPALASAMALTPEERDEQFTQGHRRAWLSMLKTCFRELGYDDPAVRDVTWVAERTEAIAMLRQVCERHGDLDWPDDLHLADIIEKHLWNSLEAP